MTKVRKWKPSSPTIKNAIFQVLAKDFAKPKRFNEIWEHIRERKVCTKTTLWVYLEGLEKIGLIRKDKKNPQHSEYFLADKEHWEESQKDYEKKMVRNVKQLRKNVDKAIKGIEKGLLSEDEVYKFVFYMLTHFEARQFQGFEHLLRGKPITPFVAPSLIEDFLIIPYNLRIQQLWMCYEKYPKATMDAIDDLKKMKMAILRTKEYKDIMNKLGIKSKPLG